MGLFSSIGGILGGIGGAILAPFTGGASIPIGAGLGSAIGGAADSNQANKEAKGYYNQQMDFAKQQFQFQQDYAKQVTQWRVEDAKKAGLHPMAALGISNPSFSPVSAPSTPQIYDAGQFDTGSTFGQSINRASMQAKTMQQQQQAAELSFQQMGLQNKGLELDNQFKALQVAQLASELQRNSASSAPAPSLTGKVPGGIDGQPDSLVNPEPMRTTLHAETGKEPGSNPSVGWLQNPDGTFSPVMSDEAKNRLEDDFVGELLWSGRNRVMPHLRWVTGLGDNKVSEPPRSLLPKGAKGWRYTGWGSYAPVFD